MGKFVKGEVVVIPFPFSDLSMSKKRPAFVLASLMGDDLILCQITSKNKKDVYSLSLSRRDFRNGRLHVESNIRPNRVFTASTSIVRYRIGALVDWKVNEVVCKVISIIK